MREKIKEPVPLSMISRMIKHALGEKPATGGITSVRGGLFNTSYKILLEGGRQVFLRVAPSSEKPLLGYEQSLLEREIHTLGLLTRYDIPAPKLLFKDLSHKIIARDYSILDFKQGQTAFYRLKHLDTYQQNSLFGQLGLYANQIHSIINQDGWFGAPPPFKRYKRWSEFVRFYALSLNEDLKSHSYLCLPEHINLPAILNKMDKAFNEVTVPRLIHGDLWWRNILIKKIKGSYQISAILDWDRSLWGDPYFEWILYGMDLKSSFWKKYRKVKPDDKAHELRVLFYKSCGCLQAALEDSIHFKLKRKSLEMRGYAISNFNALLKLLS